MLTATGRQFFPLDPRPEDVCIEDIAHALSNLCRFGGHCRLFYSVAEHSVHVARSFSDRRLALGALLHDAAEAYLVDVPRPVKKVLAKYGEIELNVEVAIAEKFDLLWPIKQPAIAEADDRILIDERDQVMPPCPYNGGWPDVTPLGATLECWSPAMARAVFMSAYKGLTVGWPETAA